MTVDTTSPRKRPWGFVLFALVTLAAAWFVYSKFFAPEPPPEYETKKVERADVTAHVSATGTLEALTTVTVGSQVSGPVLKVLVDFNSEVEEGQILAVLDPSAFQARVSQAQASLDGATATLTNQIANLANADAGVSQAEANVEVSRGQVEQARAQMGSAEANEESADAGVLKAKAEMDLALLEYKRYEELVRRELVSRSESDQKRTAYRVSEAAYQTAMATRHESRSRRAEAKSRMSSTQSELKAAQTRLQAAQAQRRAAEAQVNSAQAQVRQAQANLQTAVVDLDRATIKSPIKGTVISRKIDIGQTVQASFQAPELFKIARDLHAMQVRVEVSEADIGPLKEGQKVTFKVDAHAGKSFQGKVTQVRVGPVEAVDQTQKNNVVVYGVLVSAPNPELLLRPGMTATVEVSIDTHEKVLTVPNAATLFLPAEAEELSAEENEGEKKVHSERPKQLPGRPATVWVSEGGKPKKRDIRVGISDGEVTEVLEGDLKEGEEVIVGEKGPGQKKKRSVLF